MNTTFSYTEEAFLFSSLHEVVKVWARGNGQASFDLKIENGSAQLNLGFKLGNPASPHCDIPPHEPPSHQHHPQPHGHQHGHQAHRPRRKGPARQKRDKIRAEIYNVRQKTEAAVKLPFSGKLLPLNDGISSQHLVDAPPETIPQPQSSRTVLVTPKAAKAPSVNAAAKPSKSDESPRYVDCNVAKKQLFPASSRSQVPRPPHSAGSKKSFQRKEDDLWTKLFK